jgi:hypothetical protein
MREVLRHILYIVLTVLISLGIWWLMVSFEVSWLENRVEPIAGTLWPEWSDDFKWWATRGIFGSLIFGSLLWYWLGAGSLLGEGLSQLAFKFNHWSRNYRPVWLLLLIVPVLLALLASLFTKQANYGLGWAYFFYFMNNILTFYLGTLLFSPPSVMYVPFGAEFFRRW